MKSEVFWQDRIEWHKDIRNNPAWNKYTSAKRDSEIRFKDKIAGIILGICSLSWGVGCPLLSTQNGTFSSFIVFCGLPFATIGALLLFFGIKPLVMKSKREKEAAEYLKICLEQNEELMKGYRERWAQYQEETREQREKEAKEHAEKARARLEAKALSQSSTAQPSSSKPIKNYNRYVSNEQFVDELFDGKRNDYAASDRSIRKSGVRAETKRLIEAGKIVRRTACDKCGSTQGVQCHHYSYDRPESVYDIGWLCENCHRTYHKQHGFPD